MRRFSLILVLVILLLAAPAWLPGAQASTPTPTGPAGRTGIQQTASPAADGSIVHPVQAGESLWGIALAYNVPVANLIALNNLAATPVIFAGQKLVIRQAFTPTMTATITRTPRPPTRTLAPTRTPRPPTQTPTQTVTPSATPFNPIRALVDLPQSSRRWLGIGLILVCSIGLVLVVAAGMRRR